VRMLFFIMLLSAGSVLNAQSKLDDILQINFDEKIEIVPGPPMEPFSDPVKPELLEKIESETVRRGLERLGWDGVGKVPVTAHSRQEQIGPTIVIITEQSLYGFVAIVEVSGVVDGRLFGMICRSGGRSYIHYSTSQCAKQAADYFGSPIEKVEISNG
jgi:hypothetical protein